MKLSTMLRNARTRAGVRLSDLAARVRVSASFLCRLERGVHVRVGSRTLARLAEVLDLPLDEVFVAAGKLPPDVERYVLENLGQVRRAMARAA